MLETLSAYDAGRHLSWGDVAIDNIQSPSMVKVILKRSKTDQLGKGADVVVGKTGCSLCPVSALLAYMVRRGATLGPLLPV